MRYEMIDALWSALAMAAAVIFTVLLMVGLSVTMRAALLWMGAL